MNFIRKYLLQTLVYCSLLILTGLETLAQVRVHASVNKRSIAINDLLTVQFNIENATEVDQFVPPSFSRCKIVQGPMHVTGSSTVNGVESSYVSFVYVVQPISEGRHSFSGATAKVNGSRYNFNTVNVMVDEEDANQPQRSRYNKGATEEARPDMEQFSDYILYDKDNLHDKIRKNLFIKVDVNKSSCYEGEPVVASYKLYTRLHSESKISRRPSFNGFSVFDMVDPTVQPSTVEKMNGKEYNVYLIRKAQLFPLQSGMLELDPAEVENSVSFVRGDYLKAHADAAPELFRNFNLTALGHEAVTNEKVSIRSNPVSVNVKALPDENKPASFNGAVGTFSIESNVDKQKVALNDVATLKVIVKGEGNFCIMNAPNVKWPSSIEGYTPTIKEDFLKTVVPLKGYKTFLFTFMPKEEGELEIPAVEFSFFDVDANKYKVVKTKPIIINAVAEAPVAAVVSEPVVKRRMNAEEISETARIWIIAGSIILLSLLGFLVYRSMKQTPKKKAPVPDAEPMVVKPAPVASFQPDPLFNARLMLIQHNDKAFYSSLHKAIIEFTGDRLGLPPETGRKAIETTLKNRQTDDEVLSQLQLILQQCEEELYTPGLNDTDMQAVYDLADDYIHSFPK